MAQKKKTKITRPRKKAAPVRRQRELMIPRPSRELQKQPPVMPALDGSAETLLSQAISSGAGIDVLERLMALRRDVLAEKAKEAFNTAMAAFQEECPIIEKTKAVKTKAGAEAYKYAPIDSIIKQVKKHIKTHGFRYSTTMAFKGGSVLVTCRVVHSLGHEEVSEMEVPMGDGTNIMSKSQVVAAASTFAKRYAFLNAFGIMTGDEDDDTSSERGDAPNNKKTPTEDEYRQNSYSAPDTKATTPAAAKPAKKPKPPRGVPYYDPEDDDGASMTPKQRAFLTTRWGEYMKKRGIMGDVERAEALRAFTPWIFKREFQKEASIEHLTIQQASYLIDYVPTLPVDKPIMGEKNAIIDMPAPGAPKKPAKATTMSEGEAADLSHSLLAAPTETALDDLWGGILDYKKEGYLGEYFRTLHQAMVKRRLELNPSKKPQ